MKMTPTSPSFDHRHDAFGNAKCPCDRASTLAFYCALQNLCRSLFRDGCHRVALPFARISHLPLAASSRITDVVKRTSKIQVFRIHAIRVIARMANHLLMPQFRPSEKKQRTGRIDFPGGRIPVELSSFIFYINLAYPWPAVIISALNELLAESLRFRARLWTHWKYVCSHGSNLSVAVPE